MGALIRLIRLFFLSAMIYLALRPQLSRWAAQHRAEKRQGPFFDWRQIFYRVFRPRPSPSAPGRGDGKTYRAPSSPYEVLGVDPNADNEEIRRRYRELAARYHPDRFSTMDDEDFKNLAAEKFKALQAAYEELQRFRNL